MLIELSIESLIESLIEALIESLIELLIEFSCTDSVFHHFGPGRRPGTCTEGPGPHFGVHFSIILISLGLNMAVL